MHVLIALVVLAALVYLNSKFLQSGSVPGRIPK